MVVLAAYSPSSQGDSALAAALREAVLLQADLVVASHLYNNPEFGASAAESKAVNEALARLSRIFTHQERAYLETIEVRVVRSTDPDIGGFVIEQAKAHQAKVVILGLRHASAASKMSLGNAVRKILLGAPCPVLAAKG